MIEINLHTHHQISDNSIQIINFLAHNLPVAENHHLYSTGLHPWYIQMTDPEECIQAIEQALKQSNVIAVGECGLDRAIGTEFDLQEQIFRIQIELAQKYSKPLIIHCVRAYPELISLKKQYPSSLPWIIHGFQGNEQIATELIKHGFYFSVGELLLKNPQHTEVFPLIPTDRLFLETDDRNTSIESVYTLIAKLLKMEVNALSEIVFNNFNLLFGSNTSVVDKINSLKR